MSITKVRGKDDTVLNILAENLRICDDSIAWQMCDPRPLSVSEALDTISDLLCQLDKKILVSINLSDNMIWVDGAYKIAEWLENQIELISLQYLDLAWNRIPNEGIRSIINACKPLLVVDCPIFENLNISGNYGAYRSNVEEIINEWDISDIQKIEVISKIEY